MNLGNLQKSMFEAIAACSVGSIPDRFHGEIEYSDRFHIYQTGYRARVLSALEETYDKTIQIVRQQKSCDFIEDYISKFRFASFDLSGVCDDFPQFVQTRDSWSDLPFLSDLARLELVCAKSFHKAAHESLAFEEIARVLDKHAERVELKLQPFAQIFKSDWDLVAISNQLSRDGASTHELFRPGSASTRRFAHLVCRLNGRTRIESISELQMTFLESLSVDPSFFAACEALECQVNRLGASPADAPVAEWIKHWSETGLFSKPEAVA